MFLRRISRILESFALKSAVTLGMLPCVAGCIVVPLPDPGQTHVEYMDRKPRQLIETGETSRDDILNQLGSPTALSANPSIWVYSIKEYTATGWEICVALLLYGGTGWNCPANAIGEEKLSFLEVHFDDSRIVTQHRFVSLADGECTDSGFCWDGRPSFKTSRGTPDWHCAVHLLTPEKQMSTKIDTARAREFDLALTDGNFQMFLLQPWEPEIIFSFDDGTTKRIAVPCHRRSAHFIVLARRASVFDAQMIPEHIGRRLVMGKQTLTRVNFD